MPKLKTHRGAAKRFKVTGTGKVIKYSATRRHNLGHRSPAQKRHLRGSQVVADQDQKRVKAMLPYS